MISNSTVTFGAKIFNSQDKYFMNPKICIDCGIDGFSLNDSDGELYGYLCLNCQNAEEEASGEYLSDWEEEE